MTRKVRWIEEVWVDQFGGLIWVTYNACRCCPGSVSMKWGTKWLESGWYGVQNSSAWTKRLKERGWLRLDREVHSFEKTIYV